MVDSKSSSSALSVKDPINPRGEDEKTIQFLSTMIDGLAGILYPKNYVFCVLGRHPKQANRFCASVYTMGGKGGTRTLDIGPEMGESRCDALTKLLYKVEVEVGKMQFKDAPMK